MKRFVILGAAILALLVIALLPPALREKEGKDATDGHPVRIVASIFPVADLARQIGGDKVKVVTLLPPGASPHTFEPKPSQARETAGADLILAIGAGLDPWVMKLVGHPESDDTARRIVGLAEGLDLMAGHACHGSDCLHGSGNSHAEHLRAGNPHIWLDPVLARDHIVPRILYELEKRDPGNSYAYRERAGQLGRELDELDREISRETARWPLRAFVAFHPAWSYFAERYDLEEAGIIRESPEREPTAENIRRIIRAVENHGIRAVFAEEQFPPAIAEAIALDTSTELVFLDPLGGEGKPGRESYQALMRYNLRLMKEAMGEK